MYTKSIYGRISRRFKCFSDKYMRYFSQHLFVNTLSFRNMCFYVCLKRPSFTPSGTAQKNATVYMLFDVNWTSLLGLALFHTLRLFYLFLVAAAIIRLHRAPNEEWWAGSWHPRGFRTRAKIKVKLDQFNRWGGHAFWRNYRTCVRNTAQVNALKSIFLKGQPCLLVLIVTIEVVVTSTPDSVPIPYHEQSIL